jgi:hypothetical protein
MKEEKEMEKEEEQKKRKDHRPTFKSCTQSKCSCCTGDRHSNRAFLSDT